MKKTLMTAVSALAIMVATPATAGLGLDASVNTQTQAEAGTGDTGLGMKTDTKTKAEAEARTQNEDAMPEMTVEEAREGIEKSAEDMKESVAETAEDVQEGIAETTGEMTETAKKATGMTGGISATVIDDTAGLEKVTLREDATASAMLGAAVKNPQGAEIAEVHDIILDADGEARLVILSSGGFLGFGKKLSAFDYDEIVTQSSDGDTLGTVTQDVIAKAPEFRYDRKAGMGGDAELVLGEGQSVKKILEGNLIDDRDNAVGEVDNIALKNGAATHLIIGHDKNLGIGGENAAFVYDSLKVRPNGDKVDFKLNAQQSARFEHYRNATKP